MKLEWKATLLACLLAACAVHGTVFAEDVVDVEDVDVDEYDEYEDVSSDSEEFAERAFLVTKKYVSQEPVVAGQPFTVVLEVYNTGKSVASQITVTDAPVEQAGDLKVVSGKTTGTFDLLRPGGSASLSYSAVAGAGGVEVKLHPALIEYKASDAANEQQSSMSTAASFYVKTAGEKYTGLLLDAGRYASLGFITTVGAWLNLAIIVGVVGGSYVVITTYQSFTTASAARKRKAAEAALLKEE